MSRRFLPREDLRCGDGNGGSGGQEEGTRHYPASRKATCTHNSCQRSPRTHRRRGTISASLIYLCNPTYPPCRQCVSLVRSQIRLFRSSSPTRDTYSTQWHRHRCMYPARHTASAYMPTRLPIVLSAYKTPPGTCVGRSPHRTRPSELPPPQKTSRRIRRRRRVPAPR